MKRIMLASMAVILALSFSALAQEKGDSTEVKITGCFNKADAEGYFVIADEKTGNKVTVSGDAAMLARHANNHKVTLTGTMTKEMSKDVLKATNLQMLAVCQ
jgi:hypothetical protein